jgi:hypothetical protein
MGFGGGCVGIGERRERRGLEEMREERIGERKE